MSDLEIFAAASWAASRHTATMWWDTVMEVTIILCNIKRRILSYRKQLSNTSIFKDIHDLMHQKYRPRSLAIFYPCISFGGNILSVCMVWRTVERVRSECVCVFDSLAGIDFSSANAQLSECCWALTCTNCRRIYYLLYFIESDVTQRTISE